MEILYTLEEMPLNCVRCLPSVFLAGPTPRTQDVESWRPEAIEYFKQEEFEGFLFIPERRDGKYDCLFKGEQNSKDEFEWGDIIDWERRFLQRAEIVMFWIPRKKTTLPGFTTNVEFGYWLSSGKMVYGRPDNAEKIGYLDWWYRREYLTELCCDLQSTVKQTIDKVKAKMMWVR